MVLTEEKKIAISKLYSSPGSAAAFSSPTALYKEVQRNRDTLPYITMPDIKEYLQGIESYTMTRPVYRARKTKMPKIVCASQGYQFCVDLCTMRTFAPENQGVCYLLCCMDGFSRFAWVEPLVTKDGKSVVRALDKIFQRSMVPERLQSDYGE